jgi:chromosome segregation ATPase
MEEQLKRVQDKLQHLLKLYTSVKKENSQLREQLSAVNQQFSKQEDQIETLKQQVAVLKLNAGSWNEKDKKEIEKRLGTYIREIDRCIAILGE